MAKIIALCNYKGGCGKTSTACNLGSALALQGKRVLLLDLDGQSNLTSSLIQKPEVSIYNSLIDGVELPIVNISERLDLVPSEMSVATAEMKLQKRATDGKEFLLKRLLNNIATKYDFILLDCAPGLGVITIAALVAANEVYVPLVGEVLAMRGILMIEDAIDEVQAVNPGLSIGGIILQRFNNRRVNKEVAEVVRSQYGEIVFNTVIRECIAIAEAPALHHSIFEHDKKSNGAADYIALANEVIARYK